MKQWFVDRPVLVAVTALLAPALVSLVGLGAAAMLPDAHPAGRSAHAFALLPPGIFGGVAAPVTTPTPDRVVPAGRPQVRVPVLEYHYIRVNPDPSDRLGFNLSVTPDDFTAQMDWLRSRGYHPIDLNQLRAYFVEQVPLPPLPVVLTFDDGYEDFYSTAVPILLAHAFTAVTYVVPGFLGRPHYLTTEQVREVDGAHFEVAAHTLHHVDLTRASPDQLTLELRGSRSALEQIVGHPVLDFCYPSGKYDATVVSAAASAGFQSATTEVPGTEHAWADRLTWSRVRVNGGERIDQFAASLGVAEPTVVAPSPGV